MTSEPNATSAAVSTADLQLHYGQTAVLKGIDIALGRGKTLALLGPSGCGKTTLLRLVAGLLAPSKGSVSIAGKVVADAASGAFAPPEKRNLGMVFQDYALWPHMTVGGNVAFPLEMRGVGRADRQARTMRALDRVGLSAFADRRPSDLSGGQQQRVAIARAIVAEPQLILFDEPLSNLDRELRENMVGELAELIASLGLTAIYVTHDHSEALTLADQVAVMRAGRVEQLASPDALIANPATPEVADFLRLGGIAELERRGELDFQRQRHRADAGCGRCFGFRPRAHSCRGDHARRRSIRPSGGDRAAFAIPRRWASGHRLACRYRPCRAAGPEPHQAAPGESVGLAIDSNQVRWFENSLPSPQ
ncbi:ABC transporter ATP-binding protein [Aliirhizobium terrae]|uniref:ABC transporter ATP-binding protein n=1 Tax=Terrirhizobium terrae TaxID=2926709 RepID=UPI0035B50E3B